MIDYDPHSWREHLLDIKGSVLRRVGPRLLLVAAWAGIVALFDYYQIVSMRIPSIAHSLVGVALGLLLVFRTNASYDRYWEGRRQWGAIVNASRNLARGASALIFESPELSNRVRDWTAAFPHAAMHRLRNGNGVGAAALWLPAEEVDRTREINGPLFVATQISMALAEARRGSALTDQEQLLMDTQVAALIDAAGACDRIHKTPLPFAYVVHLRSALVLYCITLPFAMLPEFGPGEIVVTLFVSFVLLGIEEIGVEIEDPFGTDANDLPLEDFCATIERDVRRDMRKVS